MHFGGFIMKEKNKDQIIGAFVITIIGLVISIILQFLCNIPFYFTGTILILIDLLYLIVIVIKHFDNLESKK